MTQGKTTPKATISEQKESLSLEVNPILKKIAETLNDEFDLGLKYVERPENPEKMKRLIILRELTQKPEFKDFADAELIEIELKELETRKQEESKEGRKNPALLKGEFTSAKQLYFILNMKDKDGNIGMKQKVIDKLNTENTNKFIGEEITDLSEEDYINGLKEVAGITTDSLDEKILANYDNLNKEEIMENIFSIAKDRYILISCKPSRY